MAMMNDMMTMMLVMAKVILSSFSCSALFSVAR